MSRTYRRRGQRHEYRWVLRDSIWIEDVLVTIFVDAHSKQGRRVIARFHSDAYWTLRSGAALVPTHLRGSPSQGEPRGTSPLARRSRP